MPLSTAPQGAVRPARPVPAPLIRPGFWFESLLCAPYPDGDSDSGSNGDGGGDAGGDAESGASGRERTPQPQELRAPATPREAIRMIRESVRATASRMGPRQRRAMLDALDDRDDGTGDPRPGDIRALASLHRGQPVAFAYTAFNGDHFEWAVRPVTFLVLTRRDDAA
ncbi:hypothetical protein ACIBCM_25720 [Streptomyces sp. NPDC051018]|uniref:hypothetical protein n=1 Tax=Streptomyces sp. NPDC051018 TaxID=3365639 RepID=UPI0037BC98FF